MRGQLDIHAHAVRQSAQLFQKSRTGPGNGLYMDVAPEAFLLPQPAQRSKHQLTGIIRVLYHGGTEKQTLDIIAAVKVHGEGAELLRCKGGAAGVGGSPVHAVTAVKSAVIAHEHLQQGNASAVRCKAVADAAGHGAAQLSLLPGTVHAAGGTGHVVLGGVGEDFQFGKEIHTVYSLSFPGMEKARATLAFPYFSRTRSIALSRRSCFSRPSDWPNRLS